MHAVLNYPNLITYYKVVSDMMYRVQLDTTLHILDTETMTVRDVSYEEFRSMDYKDFINVDENYSYRPAFNPALIGIRLIDGVKVGYRLARVSEFWMGDNRYVLEQRDGVIHANGVPLFKTKTMVERGVLYWYRLGNYLFSKWYVVIDTTLIITLIFSLKTCKLEYVDADGEQLLFQNNKSLEAKISLMDWS